MWVNAGLATLVSLSMISHTQADNIPLYAAGSLRDALTAIVKAYEAESGEGRGQIRTFWTSQG